MNNVHFSSNTDLWATPQKLFDELNREFNFTLDVCAIDENAKCAKYYSPKDNGLEQSWSGSVFMNPPYGREIYKWVKKAFFTAAYDEETVIVGLLPARTDTKWFHDFIYHKPNTEIRFVSGRIKFGGAINNAPFPSMIVIWNTKSKDKIQEYMNHVGNELLKKMTNS